MKRLFSFLILFSMLVLVSHSQPYQWAIGARLGYPLGLPSFKYNFSEHHTMEAMIEGFQHGGQVVGLYEYHGNISDPLRWYLGAGAGVGFFNHSPYRDDVGYSGNRLAVSIHPIIGMEYTLPNAPLNFSLDYKPQFELYRSWFGYGGIALGIRYARH